MAVLILTRSITGLDKLLNGQIEHAVKAHLTHDVVQVFQGVSCAKRCIYLRVVSGKKETKKTELGSGSPFQAIE